MSRDKCLRALQFGQLRTHSLDVLHHHGIACAPGKQASVGTVGVAVRQGLFVGGERNAAFWGVKALETARVVVSCIFSSGGADRMAAFREDGDATTIRNARQ